MNSLWLTEKTLQGRKCLKNHCKMEKPHLLRLVFIIFLVKRSNSPWIWFNLGALKVAVLTSFLKKKSVSCCKLQLFLLTHMPCIKLYLLVLIVKIFRLICQTDTRIEAKTGHRPYNVTSDIVNTAKKEMPFRATFGGWKNRTAASLDAILSWIINILRSSK